MYCWSLGTSNTILCPTKGFGSWHLSVSLFIKITYGTCATILLRCLFVVVFMLLSRMLISGRVPTCDNAHSWWSYSTAPLGDQATSAMTWYPTQSHYPDIEPTSHCPLLIMQSIWLGIGKFQFKSLWIDSKRGIPSKCKHLFNVWTRFCVISLIAWTPALSGQHWYAWSDVLWRRVLLYCYPLNEW